MKEISALAALSPAELDTLADAWAIWAASAATPARGIARARSHLVFLLIRYAGLRLGEALATHLPRQMDRESGLLAVNGDNARNILIPARGLRAIRRIMTLPEAAENSFSRLDPGFVRRTFYAVAKNAGIKSARGGPRAIRYARGLELLALHTPLNVVQEYLGLRAPAQIEAFLQFGGIGARAVAEKQSLHGARGNAFSAIVAGFETGIEAAFMRLKTLSGLPLFSLVAMEEFIRIDPSIGQTLWAFIIPRQIFPERGADFSHLANRVAGEVRSLHHDTVETMIELKLESGENLEIRSGNFELPDPAPEMGEKLFACFSARAVIVCAD